MLLSSLGSTSEAIDDPIRPLHTVLPPPLMVPKYNTLKVILLYHRLKHTRFYINYPVTPAAAPKHVPTYTILLYFRSIYTIPLQL